MKKILACLLVLAILITGSSCAFAETAAGMENDPEEFLWNPEDDDGEEGSEGIIEFPDPDDPDLPEWTPEDPEWMDGCFPEIVEKRINGKDNRTTIKTANKYPYTTMAIIQAYFPCKCKGAEGTAFMVRKNKALTAAHCLICTKHNKWAKKIVLYFGYRKGRGWVYKYTGKWKAYSGTTFPNGYHDTNDWAIIKLSQNVGNRTGWLGLWAISDSNVKKYNFYTAGYRNGKLKRGKGKAKVIDSRRMSFKMDTQKGNSGGPIYRKYKGGYYAVGIITTEWPDLAMNSGIRITSSILKKVKKY